MKHRCSHCGRYDAQWIVKQEGKILWIHKKCWHEIVDEHLSPSLELQRKWREKEEAEERFFRLILTSKK